MFSSTMDDLQDINQFLEQHRECNIIESVLPANETIYALGDLHGDFSALKKALIKAKIVDKQNQWKAKNAILVQVGDIFDRGGRGTEDEMDSDFEEVKILHYLYKLNKQAILMGGKVISLIGNHELMNLLGDFRYVSKEHIEALGGYDSRKELMKPGGRIAKKIACNSLGIVQIGDWIFVHGGLLPEHIRNKKGDSQKINKDILYQINHLVRGILLGNIKLHDISQEEEKILFGGDGIFWTRKFSNNKAKENPCKLIMETMELLNLDQKKGGMVVGHTPQPSINSVCDNKIWRIDTGMSQGFGKRNELERIEILKISNNGESFDII